MKFIEIIKVNNKMPKYKIALIPGDGVGPEVTAEGVKVLNAVSETGNFIIEWKKFDFGAEHYLKTGETLTENDLNELAKNDAIYFGAVGDPRVKPGILEKEILLKLRFYFDEYVNLRPVRLFRNVPCPLKDKNPEDINFTVVRENTEDFYVGIGGRAKKGKCKEGLEILRGIYNIKFNLDIESDTDEIAYQIGVISKKGADRIIKYAFELAKRKKLNLVSSVDKANVLTEIYGFWRERFSKIAGNYPEIQTEFCYVDAINMDLIRRPERYRVIVAPNMFGDIITDLGAIIQGGMGMAGSGNINPGGISMFEPVHGSAPDIARKGIANPMAQILAGAMMLEELGEGKGAKLVVRAAEEVLKEGKFRTRDIGGTSKTTDVGDAIMKKVREIGTM